MDRYARLTLNIVVLLLASLFIAGAAPRAPNSLFTLAELPTDAPGQSPDEVRSPEAAARFQSRPGSEIRIEDRESHWWRLTVNRDVDATDAPQLVMTQPYWKRIEVWRPGDAAPVKRTVYGDDSDLTHSALAHVVPLPKGLRAGQSLFILVRSSDNVASEFDILPLAEVYARDNVYDRTRTFVLTSLALVGVLALVFAGSLRQRGYAYLAATLFAQIVSLAIEGGDFRGHSWLSDFAMDDRTNIFLNTAAVLASVRFLVFFLNLPMTQPRAARILDACSFVLGAVLFSSTFHVWYATAFVGNFALLAVIATIVPACLYAIGQRQREAFTLLAAWAPLMVVLVVKIGGMFRWWPTYEWLQFAYPAALTFGGLGLMAGLSVKLHQLSRDRDTARQRATIDGLTGVLSRPAVDEALAAAVAHAHGAGNPLSVAFVDVDHFKKINDEHGHAVGDEVLRIVAKRMQNRIGSQDVLGRYGGDEMLLLMPDTSLSGALNLSEQLRNAIADSPLAIDGRRISANLSIGVAQLHRSESVEAFLKRADEALYASKAGGRGRVTGHGEHAAAMP